MLRSHGNITVFNFKTRFEFWGCRKLKSSPSDEFWIFVSSFRWYFTFINWAYKILWEVNSLLRLHVCLNWKYCSSNDTVCKIRLHESSMCTRAIFYSKFNALRLFFRIPFDAEVSRLKAKSRCCWVIRKFWDTKSATTLFKNLSTTQHQIKWNLVHYKVWEPLYPN